jgi:hypothetical protein
MRTTQRTSAVYRDPRADVYRLKFGDDGYGVAKEIEFEAYDAHKALVIAHGEAQGRTAELWREGRKLCTIQRTGAGSWRIGPGEGATPPAPGADRVR